MSGSQPDQPEPAGSPSAVLLVAMMGFVSLIWGSTWLVIKLGLRDVAPFTGAAARFAIAGGCMALLAWLFRERESRKRPPWPAVVSQGLLQFAFNYAVVYIGETVIPSGLVAVLWAVFPLCIALASHFILRTDLLKSGQWLGMGLAFCGVSALFVTDIASVSSEMIPIGLLVLLAPVSVTVPTLLIKRTARDANLFVLNRDSMWIGAVVLGLLAVLFERDSALRLTPRAIFCVLYLAIPGTVMTFGVYLWILRHVPAYRASLISFVTPALALLMGALFGGEPLTLATLAGSGMVLSGVFLVLRRPMNTAR
jgi:drug/metabolite transporter (DMT)-like permease